MQVSLYRSLLDWIFGDHFEDARQYYCLGTRPVILIGFTIAVKNTSSLSFSQARNYHTFGSKYLSFGMRNRPYISHFKVKTRRIYQLLIPSLDPCHFLSRRTFMTTFAIKTELRCWRYSTICQPSSATLTHRLKSTCSRTMNTDPLLGLETDMSMLVRPRPPKPITGGMISS